MPVFFKHDKGQNWSAGETKPGVSVSANRPRTENEQEIAYIRTIDGLARLYKSFVSTPGPNDIPISEEDLHAGINTACERYDLRFEDVMKDVVSVYEFSQQESN